MHKTGPKKSWSELEVFCEAMGLNPETVTDYEIELKTPRRYATGFGQRLRANDNIYRQCSVCFGKFVVNAWEDRKPRTPTLAGLIVCPKCDPRHAHDRFLKKGYRIIHPDRLRIFRMTQFTLAVAKKPCQHNEDESCKCPPCFAKKISRG